MAIICCQHQFSLKYIDKAGTPTWTHTLRLTISNSSLLTARHLPPAADLLRPLPFPRSSSIFHVSSLYLSQTQNSQQARMANSSEAQDINGPSKRTLQIAFLICDEPAEPTLRKHGGFHEYVRLSFRQGIDVIGLMVLHAASCMACWNRSLRRSMLTCTSM